MIQQIATITAGILGAVILVSGAVSAAARLWRFRTVRMVCAPITFAAGAISEAWQERQTARRIAEVDIALGKLFQPNGGASLRDLADRLGRIEEHLGLDRWERSA